MHVSRLSKKLAVCGLAAALAIAPLSCGTLGGAILSLGISLIFTGASPGWALRDPAVTKFPGQPETPSIDLRAAAPVVDRVIFLGGDLVPPVAVSGEATAVGGPATLDVTLKLFRADGAGGLQIAAQTLTATSIAIGTTATPFNVALTFAKPAGTITSFPGDIAVLTLDAPNGGEVVIDTTKARVNTTIFLNREVPLTLASLFGRTAILAEAPTATSVPLTVASGGTATAQYALDAVAQPTYDLNGSKTGQTNPPASLRYRYEGAPAFSLLASATTTASFRLELQQVDANGTPIGPVLGSAGPLTAGATLQRLNGSFQMASAFFELATANTGSAEPPILALRIINAGPSDVTFRFDPAGVDSSFVKLPGPSARADFATVSGVELSQPDPAIRR